jgi:RHS repeat-associated protein
MTDFNGHSMQLSYDSFGQLVQWVDEGGGKATFTYDGFGNIIGSTSAVGTSSSSIYDAVSRLTQDQDELGRKKLLSYDALDRVITLTDPKGGKQQYTYDAVGNMLSFTDEAGNVTTYAFDQMERLTKRTSPTGASDSYGYDADSNLTAYTDRRGLTSTVSYDALNRPVSSTFADSTVTVVYDPAGRAVSLTDSMDGTFAYQYDALGELTQQAGPTGVVEYKRDAVSRVLTEQVRGQSAMNYTYDPNGQMISATMGSAGVTYSYDSRGLPTSLTRTNGVVSTFGFDGIGNVTSIVHQKGAAVLNAQTFQYDAGGNRTSVTNDLSQPITTPSSTSTVGTGNQLTSSSGTSYTYDANGNRLTETTAGVTTTYSWDARNRLTSIVDGSGNKTSMKYAGTRALLGITHPSGSMPSNQVFVEDVNENAVLQTNDGATVSVLAGRELDATYAAVTQSGATVFPLMDGLGNPIASTDQTGALSAKVSYDPFGLPTGSPSAELPLVFGNHFAVEGNILYSHARYYDAAKGRFLSEDPLGFRGGDSNLYRFAASNPTTLVDPTGLYGFGLSVGAQAEIGTGTGGVGGGFEGGLGYYFNQDDRYKWSVAGYTALAAFAGGPAASIGYPTPSSKDFVFGATIPVPGVSGYLTNARGRLDELGVFDQSSATIGIVTVNLGLGTGCNPDGTTKTIWHLSFGLGEEVGFQVSHHKTNTTMTYQSRNHNVDLADPAP